MDIFENYLSILNGVHATSLGTQPDAAAIAESTEKPVPEYLRKDIDVLRQTYPDEFRSGGRIELSLKDALTLLPRERRRTDAYTKLVKWLSVSMGITLVVKSRKRKK